jgi:hypothetical protein
VDPEIVQDKSTSDKTKMTVVRIPGRIHAGFNLRIMANTLRANNDGRKQVTCAFGTAKIRFTLRENETLGRLSALATDWIKQRGQGDQWQIEGNPREAIDFYFEYPTIPIP